MPATLVGFRSAKARPFAPGKSAPFRGANGDNVRRSFLEVPACQARLIAGEEASVGQSDLGAARQRIEDVRAGFLAIGFRTCFDGDEVAAFAEHYEMAFGEHHRAAAEARAIPRHLLGFEVN